MTNEVRKSLCLLACALALLGAGGCRREAARVAPAGPDESARAEREGMVLVGGGTFRMGSDDEMPDEAPAHEVTVGPFWIDAREVTVGEFARFVAATGYKTDAEAFGWSGVFDRETGEWARVDGADWRHPSGPGSRAADAEPVCQVSWRDAEAYARWAGKRLPTEAEWEYAARGGLKGRRYAWGDELRPGGRPVANWWQGSFPERDTGEDGFRGRAPAGSFPPNGFGLYDVAGNVWEWCADWYGEGFYASSPRADPRGPASGEERVIRGGSWMCSENFCSNYRVAARSHAAPDTGLDNLGFRCARDARGEEVSAAPAGE
ncbi:MAG TPA: formylglycine-generating enzyme family protein [Pyrinomonadaceae bacterium]|jgi:formylglycine-generating enzyme required for sulfatase activity